MIEDLLNQRESSKSILIIDSFEHKSTNLLYTFITKFLEEDHLNTDLNILPTNRASKLRLVNFLNSDSTGLNEIILEHIFKTRLNIFKLLLDELDKQKSNDPKKKFFLILDNLNLLLRHFDSNPLYLLQFIKECSKRPEISQILIVANQDSLDSGVLNQLKQVFQTVIYVNDTKMKQNELNLFSKLNKQIFKYNLKIEHRNLRSFKVLTHDEIMFIDNEYTVQKVERQIKIKSKLKEDDETEDDMLKGLTFNVHLSSDDLEAKKNLVLPYEILGQKKQIVVEKKRDEESKIFYAPDERDDVDDDDPDDDLNF
ncbi:unnamed protein product [Brachionus calyciflorus]|uniref:Elongator complex protein 5 n=1 Tax=Brachionus calyciflorus TaxID=104777 RepID=A0A813YHF1_9BILA|nr:unnamed protein product [Brachionus calyciflorus]